VERVAERPSPAGLCWTPYICDHAAPVLVGRYAIVLSETRILGGSEACW
jgi:hypothetical protein